MTMPEVPELIALLPCPGCGGTDTRTIGGPGTRGGPHHWAGCDHCHWRTWGDTEAEAIAAWNTRAALHTDEETWALAMKVWDALNRVSCPSAFMDIAVQTISPAEARIAAHAETRALIPAESLTALERRVSDALALADQWEMRALELDSTDVYEANSLLVSLLTKHANAMQAILRAEGTGGLGEST